MLCHLTHMAEENAPFDFDSGAVAAPDGAP